MVSAQYYMPKGQSPHVLRYWYPPEGGGAIGSDNMTVLAGGKNPGLAHMFINYLLDSKNAFNNFYNLTGYQPPMNDIDTHRLGLFLDELSVLHQHQRQIADPILLGHLDLGKLGRREGGKRDQRCGEQRTQILHDDGAFHVESLMANTISKQWA
jgi:hypothetical protein